MKYGYTSHNYNVELYENKAKCWLKFIFSYHIPQYIKVIIWSAIHTYIMFEGGIPEYRRKSFLKIICRNYANSSSLSTMNKRWMAFRFMLQPQDVICHACFPTVQTSSDPTQMNVTAVIVKIHHILRAVIREIMNHSETAINCFTWIETHKL